MVVVCVVFSFLFSFFSVYGKEQKVTIRTYSTYLDIVDGEPEHKVRLMFAPENPRIEYTTHNVQNDFTLTSDKDTVSLNVNFNQTSRSEIIINYRDTTSIVLEFRYEANPLTVLQDACEFNMYDNREFPAFTYQAHDNPDLVKLRKKYKLDSIAGYGNEISRILNLMHWVHNLIPHDGKKSTPETKNALFLIEESQKNKTGLDCRGLSTILNESYLALGFRSRMVSCLPKDTNDREYHVVNTVYSRRWNKWVLIDPTHDAYFINRDGELYSLEEVRQRLIQGKPVALNPESNWNRRFSMEKGDFLYNYMAKKLYRFICVLNNEFNAETKEKGKTITYIRLSPPDYYYQKPDKFEINDIKSGAKIINYRTSNAMAFWQAP